MPPRKETAKKLHSEDFGGESESSNARGKRKGMGKEKVTHQQGEETTGIQFLSLAASSKPRPQKPGSRHRERLDHYLNQYRDEMARQDEDGEGDGQDEQQQEEKEKEGKEGEKGAGYPSVSEKAEPLSRKRSFGEAEFHPSDESESGTLKVRRSKRNVLETGNRPNTRAASRRRGESDHQVGSRTGSNQGPPTGFTPVNR